MRCIAIDDEPLALNIIKEYVEKIPFLKLEGMFSSALEVADFVISNKIDLMFVDIQMPHLSGLDFIKTLPEPPMVIFTTAYSDYALDGYEINAIDYLLKPFSFERFLKAVQKANELYVLKNKNSSSINNNKNIEKNDDFILLKADYSLIKIDISKIQYIEGLKDYVKVYYGEPRPLLPKITMKSLEEKLPSDIFVRIHKSFIISIKHIEAIEKNSVKIAGKTIPIGNQYKEHFWRIIKNKNLIQ